MNADTLERTRTDETARQAGFACRIYCCAGTSCLSAEGESVFNSLIQAVASHAFDGSVEVVPTGCMGLCSEGPLVRVEAAGQDPVLYARVTPLLARLVVAEHVSPLLVDRSGEPFRLPDFLESHTLSLDMPFFGRQERVVLARIDRSNPECLTDAVAHGAYAALADCLADSTPGAVIEMIDRSGLRGRGGGGYETGRKWRNAAAAAGAERFVICNGDEGDPGAYMDRSVLEGDPHAVLEGMLIAAYAIGARRGYVYIRAEYELAVKRMRKAIEEARRAGLLGPSVLQSGLAFDCEVYLGAGAFVCGEETALIASIEGERGTPRPRPPYPSEQGLFGRPTVINNVETLANVPAIVGRGADRFRSLGTDESPGTKVFSLAGRGRYAGLIEVPMGTPLRDVVETIGGGARTGRAVLAVQTGGLSAGIVTADALDTPLTYEAMSELGSIIGSGSMIVLDERDDLLDLAHFYIDYAVQESCGRCAACRIGSRQLLELVKRMQRGDRSEATLSQSARICEAMRAASLCGLGKAAPRPLLSVLRHVAPAADREPVNEVTA